MKITMSTSTYKKNDDLESGSPPDKMAVYQECIKVFNITPIQPRKSRQLIAKLLNLLYTGETFPENEATNLFFGISKLFQHKDPRLRQIVLLIIKELASSVGINVFIVTSSIMKDVQVKSDVIYKPDAIRSLIRVIDPSTIPTIERLIKNSIVDSIPAVSSAALISSYHLSPVAKDVIKRWSNEAQEAVLAQKTYPASYGYGYMQNSQPMTQYHAIGLLYTLRSHDKMALLRFIQQFSNANALRSPNAIVMLIRFIAKILDDDPSLSNSLYPFLEGWLKHKADSVDLEAAKTILEIKNVNDKQAASAVNVLQLFLSSPRTVARFSAIRILNKFSLTHSKIVSVCNIELESLISDNNRSIATYAITTLLKTGNENSVDRLMKQISGFMDEITDEFKIIVVDAIRSLALKFPSKHSSMIRFFSDSLRDEGGYNFKNAVVESLFDLIKFVPESRDTTLAHLCEFIEDCEYVELAVRILYLLGQEGPNTHNPNMYIRYIYNRVVLENSTVRAAAVVALSKFALVDDKDIVKSIKVLLRRSLDDVDDEVRDRAALCLDLLDENNNSKENAKNIILPEGKYSLPVLEYKLANYLGNSSGFVIQFDISDIPIISNEQAKQESLKLKTSNTIVTPIIKTEKKETSADKTIKRDLESQKYINELTSIDNFSNYGKLLNSSIINELTEKESEFYVTCVKHLFSKHLVLQFNISNTLTDTILEDVSVLAEPDNDDYIESFILPIERLDPNSEGIVYVSFERSSSDYSIGTFTNVINFTTKEIDPSTGEPADEGFSDEYPIEDLDITAGDFITPSYIGNFTHAFDELSGGEVAMYNLSEITSLKEAISRITELLSMTPVEGTDEATSNASHTLKLFGKSINGEKVAAIVKMAYSSKNGVTVKIQARAENESLAKAVSDGIS